MLLFIIFSFLCMQYATMYFWGRWYWLLKLIMMPWCKNEKRSVFVYPIRLDVEVNCSRVYCLLLVSKPVEREAKTMYKGNVQAKPGGSCYIRVKNMLMIFSEKSLCSCTIGTKGLWWSFECVSPWCSGLLCKHGLHEGWVRIPPEATQFI